MLQLRGQISYIEAMHAKVKDLFMVLEFQRIHFRTKANVSSPYLGLGLNTYT